MLAFGGKERKGREGLGTMDGIPLIVTDAWLGTIPWLESAMGVETGMGMGIPFFFFDRFFDRPTCS